MRRNVSIVRGESTSWTGVLRDDEGSRVDLTSLTLTWKAGDKDFRREDIILTEGDGITIVDAARGEWKIDLRNGDTKDLSEGLYVHQGFASDGSNENLLFTNGRLTLRGNIR